MNAFSETNHHKRRRRRPAWNRTALALVALLSWLAVPPITAQEDVPPGSSPEEPAFEPTPIPDVEISARAASTRDLVREAASEITFDDHLREIEREYPLMQQRVAKLRGETDELLRASGSTSLIQETEKDTLRARDRLARWIRDLSSRSEALQSTLGELCRKNERSGS